MDDVMRRARAVDAPPPVARARVYTYYENLICETCGSGDRDDDLLLCDRCDRGHHTFCLRPIAAKVPIGPWFCPVCAPPAKAPKSASFPRLPRRLHLAISLPRSPFFIFFLPSCCVIISHCFFSFFVGIFRIPDEADQDHRFLRDSEGWARCPGHQM
jgi:hypothetical protein